MASKTRARSRRRRASQTVRRRRASQTVRRRRASQPAPRRASFPHQPRRPPPRPLYRATPDLLAHGRRLFEQSGETIPAIAAVMGCSRATVYRIARSEHWVRHAPPPRDLPPALKLLRQAEALAPATASPSEARRAGVGCNAAEKTPTPTLPLAGGGSGAAAANEAEADVPPSELPPIAMTIDDLHRIVVRELEIVRAMRAHMQSEPQSPLDAQRTASALATHLQTLKELQRRQAESLHAGLNDDDDFPTDIDAFRDELARRIDAFIASRADEEAAGGDPDQGAGAAGA